MSEVEVYQLFGEVWGREGVSDGTKMSGICQMDTFPFEFPLEN